jgi:hypothetical protein
MFKLKVFMSRASRGLRRLWQGLLSLSKLIVLSIFWLLCIYGLWQLVRPTICVIDETTLSCLRQWQSVISALIALFVASVGWKLSQASIAQSVKLATFNRLEILGDRYDDDWRALKRFETEFIAARVAVDFHLDGEREDLSKHDKQVLDSLSFPRWPVPYWENYLNHCLDEWRDHYYAAAELKASNRTSGADYIEHRERIKGIFEHLMSELKVIETQRKELFDKDTQRLS